MALSGRIGVAAALLFAEAGATGAADTIRRLDGSRISVEEAQGFAGKTLTNARVTGAQIVILDQGKTVWSAAFGSRRRDPDLPMRTDTNIWAASITKSVFATYAMLLAERGEIAMNGPIAQQLSKPLTEYEAYRESATEIVRDPRWQKVTPRILLSHTAGLANFAFLEPDKKLRLHFEPGTAFRYSGEGINLVQLLVEEKKGKPLDRLMQETIFTPLQMTGTGMIYRAEFAENVADRFGADGKFHAQTKRFPARAAGSMATTSEDLARFAVALLDDRILKPATRKEMLRPVIRIRTLHQFPLRADEPEGQETAAVGLAYGTGWGLLTKTPFGPAFFKEGHGDGAQTYMICFERRKACMILLTNSDNGELAFRPLMEKLFGNTVTPWEWEGYTPKYIEESRKHQ